ncbi:recombinase family protein [Methylomarinum sp. Ch1-1]|uniref:Recombinase family protein n=1 Tax=Methylomarinum roseum TaxID=3067653 RepID=A0AAU7NWU9_9GAMM|nr:recombinase family protein [Methylomarinum sp. Ch1-1]MDP4522512.1 recombinase family protein [Methylomarinum sp. Ch1-1]
MAKIGYARVSSTGQSLDAQLKKLTKYCGDGDSEIFQEKHTGTTDNRPQLKACLRHLRKGDQLVVTKLDRLARSTLHLTQIADDLQTRGIELVVLDQNIDTSTPTGKLLFNMLASIAEFETALRKERQTDGIAKAKENGVKFGAKSKLTPTQITELKEKRASGTKIKDLMSEYQISKATAYRLLSD